MALSIPEKLFLDSLLSDLLALAVTALLDLLAVLFAELVLQNLGEQEVSTGSSCGSANDDTNDHEDLGVILLFLVEAEHKYILL